MHILLLLNFLSVVFVIELIFIFLPQLMSQQPNYVQFFFQVADLGCTLRNAPLREGARMLLSLVPPDTLTVQRLTILFKTYAFNGIDEHVLIGSDVSSQITASPVLSMSPPTIENMFYQASPSQVLYNLEVSLNFSGYAVCAHVLRC